MVREKSFQSFFAVMNRFNLIAAGRRFPAIVQSRSDVCSPPAVHARWRSGERHQVPSQEFRSSRYRVMGKIFSLPLQMSYAID
jgi:hypothetical protein